MVFSALPLTGFSHNFQTHRTSNIDTTFDWRSIACTFWKKEDIKNPLEDSKWGSNNSSDSLGRHHRACPRWLWSILGATHLLCHGGLVYLLIVKPSEPPVINCCHEDQYRTIRWQTYILRGRSGRSTEGNQPTASMRYNFRKMVDFKLLVGDVTAAVRIIASDDSVITPTSEVVTALRLKHPPSPLDIRPPPTEPVSEMSSVSEEEVMVALKPFYPSSVDGVDRLRPGHLNDLVAPQTVEAGRRLLKAIANLCSKLLRGQIPQHARDLLFAANLTALRKKDGGIRPIAVGNVFRRLASKIAVKRVIPELRRQQPPVELGVGVSGGCEATAHAVRVFVQSPVVPVNNVLVKLDIKNTLNTVRRDHFLEVCTSRAL